MAELTTLLKAGTVAPDFAVADQDGNIVSLKNFLGKRVILYFYPQDNTPTCTKEACNLRDNYATLTAHGFVVLGVSPDAAKSHQKFIAKFELPFVLLADTEHEILKKYGVWGEKSMYGKKYDGVHRTTYVIDETGKIAHVIAKVDSAKHAEQVLALFA
jgi:thioredoxin-dependent peroxiredoxin